MLQADQAVQLAACVASQPQGVPHAGYPDVLQLVEYPDPLPLMLDASIDCEHPAQLKFTDVVQYQQSSVCVVTHGLPAGQVLVRVLVLLAEQALQADQAPQALSDAVLQIHGVAHTG